MPSKTALPLASVTQLAGIKWVPQSVSCSDGRGETHRYRSSTGDCPAPGLHLADRESEQGAQAQHDPGRRDRQIQ